MGAKEVKPPPVPEKTLKEMIKEFSKSINKMRREFQREIYKLQSQQRKMKAELEKMMKKNEPVQSKRIMAQNILRNQRFMQRYQKLDVQLEDMMFQMNTVATTDTLVNVMKNMAEMMGKTSSKLNVASIEEAMASFQYEMEKGNIISEQIEDALNTGEEQIDDQAADQLIAQYEEKATSGGGSGGNKQTNVNTASKDLDDFENRMNALK